MSSNIMGDKLGQGACLHKFIKVNDYQDHHQANNMV